MEGAGRVSQAVKTSWCSSLLGKKVSVDESCRRSWREFLMVLLGHLN